MRKHQRNHSGGNGWNRLFAASLAVLCIGLGCTVWTVIRNTRGVPQPVLETGTVTPSYYTEDGTMPAVAVANWQPAARLLEQTAALAQALDLSAVEDLVDKGFRSVILPAAETLTPEVLQQAKEALDYLGEQGIYRTLTVTPVEKTEFPALALSLSELISQSSFDALLISDSSGKDAGGQLLSTFVTQVKDLLEKAKLTDLPVTFEIPDTLLGDAGKTAQAYVDNLKLIAGTLPKPEFLVQAIDPAAAAELLKSWGETLSLEDAAAPITALLDVKSAIPNGTLQETLDFLTSLTGYKEALVLQTADYVPKSQQAAKLLAQFFSNDLDLSSLNRLFTLMKPVKTLKSEQTIHTDKPTVNFTGSSSPLFELLCNGKEMTRNESGDFSLDFLLEPGTNTFKFEHQDQTYTVYVIYDVVVIQSVTPASATETTGGIDFMVSVSARRGATVRASLGGQSITLKPGAAIQEDGTNLQDESSVFIDYIGSFWLPASGVRKSLGKVLFSAAYQGTTDWKTGGQVTLLPDIAPTPPTSIEPDTTTTTTSTSTSATSPGMPEPPSAETTSASSASSESSSSSSSSSTSSSTASSAPTGNLLTPGVNHGLGKAQMVRVKAAYANCHWGGSSDTRSVPTSSPLLEGTYDYVAGVTKAGSYTYYALDSGKRVDAKDVEVISSGYKLPPNNLQASSSVVNGALTMRFGVSWKIPFNVNLLGQNYSATYGYSGYTYGVGSYTATGLEITFYHTGSYGGKVDVSGFSLLSSAEWSAAKNTVTLKLMFKNAGKFYGYKAYYENNQLVISLRPKPASTLSGARIYLDIGHGGSDPGAALVAPLQNMQYEKQVNFLIGMKVKAKLEAKNATVITTRTDDAYVSLDDRVLRARQANADMFISIHADSAETATPMGTSAFYYRAYGQPLAKAIHNKLVSAWKDQIYTKANYPSDYATLQSKADHGTYFYPFQVTRMEECPAVLVEYGFGSNLTECRALQKDQYQEYLAQATVDGIADYLAAAQ